MSLPIKTGTGAPSFCWVCNRRLRHVNGKRELFYFAEVRDPLGHLHRIHGSCEQELPDDVQPTKEEE